MYRYRDRTSACTSSFGNLAPVNLAHLVDVALKRSRWRSSELIQLRLSQLFELSRALATDSHRTHPTMVTSLQPEVARQIHHCQRDLTMKDRLKKDVVEGAIHHPCGLWGHGKQSLPLWPLTRLAH